ncbi:maleylpyruvate isomerase family mycothiol-dependent enzyme [Streptomyces sp. BR1]|uniref:maleylpyruvate isomerase family mycothiol-dependent enzyme n=1 Tax=Streptomyces sp. BR1 TaxID=1592323 RepID=UPI00402BE0A5
MDYVAQFHRETEALEAAVRRELATGGEQTPLVPSCPGWSLSDLVMHLGSVHRYVIRVIEERAPSQPDSTDLAFLRFPGDAKGWPHPEQAPNRGPLPPGLLDWFADGAARLERLFATRDPREEVWTWSTEQTVGFWQRIQAIEAAVHRWDAENTVGKPGPVDTLLAVDAVTHTFRVMAPFRRAVQQAPRGSGERMRFRQSDGAGIWIIQFEGDEVLVNEGTACCDVELTATASDLMLFLWQRVPADHLEVRGDRSLLDRYFTLVPPL